MSALHTPGPWAIEVAPWWTSTAPASEHAGGYQILSSSNRQEATVLCTRTPYPERAEEMMANARLIAAAPELLAALRELLDAADASVSADTVDDVAAMLRYGEAHEIAREVVLKATETDQAGAFIAKVTA